MRPAHALAVAMTVLGLMAPAGPAAAAGTPPGQPVAVTATPATDGVEIDWGAPAVRGDGIDHYEVSRSDGTVVRVASTAGHLADRLTTAASPGTAAPGTAYTWTVRAVGPGGTGPSSIPAAATTPSAEYDGGPARVLSVDAATDTRVEPRTSTTYAAPADTVTIGGDHRRLRVAGLRIRDGGAHRDAVILTAPAGEQLSVGTFAVTGPGGSGWTLDLEGELYGCPQASGTVTVADLRFDSDGVPAVADLDYAVRCTAVDDPVRGVVRVRTRSAYTAVEESVVEPGEAVAVGTAARATVTVLDTGNQPVTLGSASLGAGHTPVGEWQVDDSACAGVTLQPGGSCAVRLTATAGAAGLRGVVLRLGDTTAAGVHERAVFVRAVDPPRAPFDLTATRDRGGVTIAWTRADTQNDAATALLVLRGPDARRLAPYAWVSPSGASTFTDTRLGRARGYAYAVESRNVAGAGRSAPLWVTFGRGAPTGVAVQPLAQSVGVTWSPPPALDSVPVSGYVVYAGPDVKHLKQALVTGATAVRLSAKAGKAVAVQVAARYGRTTGSRSRAAVGRAGAAELDAVLGDGNVAALPVTGGRPVPLGGLASADGIVTARSGKQLFVDGEQSAGGSHELFAANVPGGPLRPVAGSGARDAADPAVSADGSLVAYTALARDGSGGTRLHVTSPDGEYDHALQDSAGLFEPSFVGGGSDLVAADPQGLVLWRHAGTRERLTTDGGTNPSVSPDGRSVAYLVPRRDSTGAVTAQELRLLQLGRGAGTLLVEAQPQALLSTPRWDPTGTRLTYARHHLGDDNGGDPVLLDVRRRREHRLAGSQDVAALTWSQPDQAPPVARVVRVQLGRGARGAYPVAITFQASDALSGVNYVVLRSRAAKPRGQLPKAYTIAPAWRRLTASPARGTVRGRWRTCFSAQAVDYAGNRSAWSREVCVAPR